MIDGIKAILKDNLDAIRNNQLLDFQLIYVTSVSTGETKPRKKQYPIAKYKSLTFVDKGTVIEVRGSIHKMINDGKHNYDQFGLSRIHLALYELADQLSIVTNNAEIKNLEFGVNLTTEFEPTDLLNSIVYHKSEMFIFQKLKNMKYRECSHGQYFIKIYDKGIQYGLDKYILRVEVKYIKMEKINRMGIKYLSDLLNPAKLEKLRIELLRIFNDILIGDLTVDTSILSTKDQVLFAQGHNPNFWDNFLPRSVNYTLGAADQKYISDVKKYQRKMNRFKKLLQRTGADGLKNQVQEDIENTTQKLIFQTQDICSGNQKCPELTGIVSDIVDTKVSRIDRVEKKDKVSRIDPLLYSDNNLQIDDRQEKKCIVTGLDISMQKDDSIYLCTSGIKYYMKNDPKVYDELRKRLSNKWRNAPVSKQIEEMHHSIRNEHFNKKHNNRRDIQKILGQPSLFNQIDLISKERLQLAEIAS